MSFAEDLSFGREGEAIVRNLLESSGNFDYVIDCSNDKYFQEKDIDLLALAMDGHIAKPVDVAVMKKTITDVLSRHKKACSFSVKKTIFSEP